MCGVPKSFGQLDFGFWGLDFGRFGGEGVRSNLQDKSQKSVHQLGGDPRGGGNLVRNGGVFSPLIPATGDHLAGDSTPP